MIIIFMFRRCAPGVMPGYLLAAAFHKQAFASATQHQLLAFLQVAAFTNRTAVLPFARVGEPAFVGFPEPGFGGLDRYFDVAGLAARWPCLRAITYDAFRREAPRARIVALQLGLPPGRAGSLVAAGCGRRSRPLVALGATFACASAALAASASATRRDATRWRRDAVIVTNWSQKLVGLGDAASPLFGERSRRAAGARTRAPAATRARSRRSRRGGTREPTRSLRRRRCSEREISSAPTSAQRARVEHVAPGWLVRARGGRQRARELMPPPNADREARKRCDGPGEAGSVGLRRRGGRVDVALHGAVRRGRRGRRNTRGQRPTARPAHRHSRGARHAVEPGQRSLSRVARARRATPPRPAPGGGRVLRRVRRLGARLRRSSTARIITIRRGKGSRRQTVSPAQVAEAAICRRAAEVLRFGSGTFSAFVVGDSASRPPSAQFLSCPEIERAAARAHQSLS